MFRKVNKGMYLNIVNTLRQLTLVLFNSSIVSSTSIYTDLEHNLHSNNISDDSEFLSSNSKRSINIEIPNSVQSENISLSNYSNTSCGAYEDIHINNIMNHTSPESNVSVNSTSNNDNDITLPNRSPSQEFPALVELCFTEDEIYSIFTDLNDAIHGFDNGSMGIDDGFDYIETEHNIMTEIEKNEHFTEPTNFENSDHTYSTLSETDIISVSETNIFEEVIADDETIDNNLVQSNNFEIVSNTNTDNINSESDHNIDYQTRSQPKEIYKSENPLFDGTQDYEFSNQGETTVCRKRPIANIIENTNSNSIPPIKKLNKDNILEIKEPQANQTFQNTVKHCLNKTSDTLWVLNFSINDQDIIYQYNPQISTSLFMECLSPYNYRSIAENIAMNSIVSSHQKLFAIQVSFSFPIFTLLKFQTIGPIKFLRLNIVSNIDSLNVIIRGSVYFTEMNSNSVDYAFLLENISDYDHTMLFYNLLGENFPIYNFSNIPHKNLIKFKNSYFFKSRGKISMRKFLTDLRKKNFKLNEKKNVIREEEIYTLMSGEKLQCIDWKTSTKLAMKYIRSFLAKICKIIPNLENRKGCIRKEDLHLFINIIIKELKWEWNIIFSHSRDDLYSEEEEIISLYIFLHREVRLVLEYWNRHFFNEKQIKYTDNKTLLEVYLRKK